MKSCMSVSLPLKSWISVCLPLKSWMSVPRLCGGMKFPLWSNPSAFLNILRQPVFMPHSTELACNNMNWHIKWNIIDNCRDNFFSLAGIYTYYITLLSNGCFRDWRTRCYTYVSCALQRQNTEISKKIFPEKKCPNFHIHASVSDLYIPTIGLPILLEEICTPLLGLYKSLTDTWMWKLRLRPRYSQKRNT